MESVWLMNMQQYNASKFYNDPSGTGGNYAIGMLSTVEPDLLGLSFDASTYQYVNIELIYLPSIQFVYATVSFRVVLLAWLFRPLMPHLGKC